MSENVMANGHRDEGIVRRDASVEISNEFALVRVARVHTRNGERLEIEAPKLGYRTLLDAVALETLTWQPPETFSAFLEHPFGPHE